MKLSNLLFFSLLLLLSPVFTPVQGAQAAGETDTYSYESHTKIILQNIHATAENPFIIEGYEITASEGNCIQISNCSHIIIRNNYLHDCEISRNADHYGIDFSTLSWQHGSAILVGDSNNITIENNKLDYNRCGIQVYNTPGLKILNNDIQNTVLWRSIAIEKCDYTEIAGNYLEDNGVPEWFWSPGIRICGIHTQQCSFLSIHNNTIIRSTSDGILVMGCVYAGSITSARDDWTTTSHDINIYDNIILDNMEIGICIIRVTNMKIYNNTIREGAFTKGGCICFHFDVTNAEVYNNKTTPTLLSLPMQISLCHDCYIHDNLHYYHESYLQNIDSEDGFVGIRDDEDHLVKKAGWAGIPTNPSSRNVFENNYFVQIGGDLLHAIQEKLELANNAKTYEEKGWFAAEIEEGVFDQKIIDIEAAKGDQGVPAEWIEFDPLMADSNVYAMSAPSTDEPIGWSNRARLSEILVLLGIVVVAGTAGFLIYKIIRKKRLH